ncbi:carboxypeptidase-like regulatory domain-containing protein [Mangrovibacterium marinum]|uniref:Outer membrane receptor protein involved in Fe transport n=1 Tax=Mangrovibacterium marinum TaxID=1639118 RepID=A0A2T5C4N8_9BACT|nr:carboxypeptidase-like regulatory domain-containing protein [Mangrovibacterium marinum]PTN09814.1 outer membrane receptor protein involved in Fe transport [Mangrovibacterium marinum]
MKPVALLTILLGLLFTNSLHAQMLNALLSGTVSSDKGEALAEVNISLKGYPIGTTTDKNGHYTLQIPVNRQLTIVFSMIGCQTQEQTLQVKASDQIKLDIQLAESNENIAEVTVRQQRAQQNMSRIDPQFGAVIPDASSGAVEALIKTLPGVSTNNELSSQYSVRGGNYDENLVYVNDIEVYRPFLLQSGQQEGLSFINADLVSSIEFSSGGFDAKYGDKMASVLDIRYRQPKSFAASASASLLGGALHVEDASKNKKLSFIGGARYKTNRYLLNSLDEEGDYNPDYTDLQAYVTYRFSDAFDISFLGNMASNDYLFIPQTRTTSFGTWTQPLQAKVYFNGQEKDHFNTKLGALAFNFHPDNQLNLKFIFSAFNTNEEVSYDIEGQYYLNELERDWSTSGTGDSILNLGVGSFLNHARNKLDATVFSITNKGAYNSEEHLLNWGIKFQFEDVDDRVNEWVMRDSTGYSLPYSPTEVLLYSSSNTDNQFSSWQASAHLQDTWAIPMESGKLFLTSGLRANYRECSGEFLLSPRVSASYVPDWERQFIFHLSGGRYVQPAFIKELKDRTGNVYPDTKAQKSWQLVAGSEYLFQAWDRPFRFKSELYYKYFSNLTPYQVNNVQIQYLADQQATGYAAGLDLSIHGEFVSGVQSWASISLLQTEENVKGDGHGWIPRPTDQLLTFSLFFQDYFPGDPSYKLHLAAFYGSRLPSGPPNGERYMDNFRMPPYRRIDLGISKSIINAVSTEPKSALLKKIKELSLSLEVLNLLGIKNTVSYFWVSSHYGDMYGVPNYLTERKLNLRLSLKF